MRPARRRSRSRGSRRSDSESTTTIGIVTAHGDSARERVAAWWRRLAPAADVLVVALYAGVIVWAASRHEPWRDEVVPLSIARHAGSLRELAEPLGHEGHPILWYLLLWVGYGVIGSTAVLKAASVASAIGAIVLLNRSALPRWMRWLFTFSFFPLYQYSVVSRGYSLEMLLLFAFCAAYPSRREHPIVLAMLLAGLANTEMFGLIMSVGAVTLLVSEALLEGVDWRRVVADRRIQGAVAAYLVGLALVALVATPDPGRRLSSFQRLDPANIVLGVAWAVAQPAAHSASFAIVPLPSLWLWGYFAFIARRPPVLCFAAVGLIGIEILFNLLYGAGAPWNIPWHIGNVFLLLVAVMWIDASGTVRAYSLPAAWERGRIWLGRILAVGFAIVLLSQVERGVRYVAADVEYDYSSNLRLAGLLRGEPALADAIVLGEPDAPLWSLPYYADNRIYLAREGTIRPWGVFAPPRQAEYDLGRLLDAAHELRDRFGAPVVVTMGWDLAALGTHTNFRGTQFEERFVVTEADRARFLEATQLLARLRGPTITDENYDVFVLR